MAGLDQAYTQQERQRAIAWKYSSASLPAEARVRSQYVNKDGVADGAPYDFCLPVDFAHLSLLPEVREPALALFSELGIPWHAGVGDGPSNHLLSSQVQCVNALGQMVADPSRLIRAFGSLLGTEEVLQIEPGRYLTFEYIGDTDYFNEGAISALVERTRHSWSVRRASCRTGGPRSTATPSSPHMSSTGPTGTRLSGCGIDTVASRSPHTTAYADFAPPTSPPNVSWRC